MENPASQASPDLRPEVLALLEDHPRGFRPSRARQIVLMEEALGELARFGPLLEIRLGQVLAPMLRGGHKHLGYVTPAMFCREELGISATAAWDSVRLTEGLLQRPILRQVFLEGRLPRTHALELLRLEPQEDAGWAARAAGLSVQELRRAARPLRPSRAGEEREGARIRTYDLEAEPYAMWLAAVELARRREGRDLNHASVLEQILAEFAAGRPLDAPLPCQDDPRGPVAEPEAGGGEATPAPPPFQRDPRWPGTATASALDAGGPEVGAGSAAAGAVGPEAGSSAAAPEATPPPELPCLLRQELPRSPRRLTRLARRLLASRERLELLRGRVLRRVQEGRLYREAGSRSFRAWLESLGIAASTAFQATARDQLLERHEPLRQALSEGRLPPTKVDLLLRLPRRADAENWVAYAECHTCRRLEEAVEAALVLASRFPATWNHRRGSAPGDEETLEDFRRQAGLQAFESTCEDLALAFQQAESNRTTPEGVQTSATPAPTPESSLGATSPKERPAGGARSLAAASQIPDGTLANAEIPGTRSESTRQPDPGASIGSPATLCLRLVLPESVDLLLQAAEAHLRRDAGEALTGEECLYVLCLVFLRQAGSEDCRQSRVRRQALERAGYRCEVPGCVCRTNLHVHHIQRRSQGGSDELSNLAVVCAAHHLRHLHGGTMRVEGADPVTRIWEIGLQEGEPWRVWCDERLVDGEALAWEGDEGETLDPESPDAEPLEIESPKALPPGEDRVCEAIPEYRAGPVWPPPGTHAA